MNYKKNSAIDFPKKLILASLLVGLFSALTGIALKIITEHFESILSLEASENVIYVLLFPFTGLILIYLLRHYFFRKKENKGIKEIFDDIQSKSKGLPAYKIPSHFINGLITVAFGGTTGIEVSTVVASATIGSVASKKENTLHKYKTELICAGVAAGITALFGSPVAGILFAVEVIAKRTNRFFFAINLLAVTAASVLVYVMNEAPLFAICVETWHYYAIPWFIVLGILAGMNAVYLTKCVVFAKALFGKIDLHFYKIIIGAVILSAVLSGSFRNFTAMVTAH
ncbi:chloride channel protein [Flavobacterium sp. 3HN19-14]|uniref:chloride channel protein n=1 Tax=Flavobacterium sp. 3HN19-14 TaxID=3448133 RepID=UPI003EE07667